MRWIRFTLFALMLMPLATFLVGCGSSERQDTRQDERVETRTSTRTQDRVDDRRD